MNFSQVAQSFSGIEHESSRNTITTLLADLLKQASPDEAEILCNLALGQLHPPYISTQFNMAQKMVARSVAIVLDTSESQVLDQAKEKGDMGLVVQEGTWSVHDELTILDVYQALKDIEQLEGTGSQEEKVLKLAQLFRHVSPLSACYIVRIILGKLRLGFSDMTIIDALSWMEAGDKSLKKTIEHAYNVCADIGLIAKILKQDGIQALEDMVIHVGIPIRPAAAERLPTARAIFEKLGPCVVQPKLDGFRLQIHLDKQNGKEPQVRFFSRNLIDMSDMFPDLKEAVAALPVQSLICEGEAIAYDPHTGMFAPFQETVKRKRKHDIDVVMGELPLQVFLFDLLYLNGKDVLAVDHATRRKQFQAVFEHVDSDLVYLTEEKEITSSEDLEDYFNQCITHGLEGVVVKRSDAPYQPGKRNFNWIKLKRQEEGQLEDTIDAVILGYYAGTGRRTALGIGAFLVGVYNEQEDRFETIAKIGTGLKDDEWKDLKKRCDERAVSEQPKNVVCAKEHRPDVWTYPELVCMIRADEITLSPLHAAGKTVQKLGYALRFPRFMGYRPDKQPEQATQVVEIETLYADQFARKK